MKRVGKGFSGVDTLLFEGMLVPQQVQVDIDAAAEDEDAKIAQALEITKLKQRVRRLEKKNADEDVTLEEVAAEVIKDADVQGRLEESQAQVYHMDLEHAQKVLKVVTAAAATTTAAATITAALMPTTNASKRRKVEEPKPLKKQAHIEQDEAYARELEAELNANINWNEVIEHVKRKEKQDNAVLRYQALKRKPQIKAHARKNMMVYLKNMVGFKMDFFKGMSYDDIRPIFEKHFNSIVAFLEKGEKEIEEKASKMILLVERRKVENLDQAKIAQALEITKLKQRVRRLDKKNADEDVTLEEVAAEVIKDADVHGRLEESQAQVYHMDLEHAQKVLKVVTAAAAATTIAAATITAALMPTANASRRRKVEEPKPLKKQPHIEQDEVYARELESELNANINWNEVIEQVKRKEKQDNAVLRYQALKRKPQIKAHAGKNMMVYLKNMVGFKMDFFKGMSYDDIRPIFEKHFNSIVAFLEKGEKEIEEKASKVIKRKSETSGEDLEMLWQIVQERFASSDPKNFSCDFLLNTFKTMFEKPNVEAHIWKTQRGDYGLAKVKSWKFFRILKSSHHHFYNYADDPAS
nr:hypothetical protein [Tanacetum cinerariifolium]